MEKKNPNIYQRALDIVNNRINPDIPQGGGGGSSDAVQYIPQELTEAQQMQARKNQGLYYEEDVVGYLLEEITVDVEEALAYNPIPESPPIVGGEKYILVRDGVEWEVTAGLYYGMYPYVGFDPTLEDLPPVTEPPVCLILVGNGSGSLIVDTEAGTHTYTIKGAMHVISAVDKKYVMPVIDDYMTLMKPKSDELVINWDGDISEREKIWHDGDDQGFVKIADDFPDDATWVSLATLKHGWIDEAGIWTTVTVSPGSNMDVLDACYVMGEWNIVFVRDESFTIPGTEYTLTHGIWTFCRTYDDDGELWAYHEIVFPEVETPISRFAGGQGVGRKSFVCAFGTAATTSGVGAINGGHQCEVSGDNSAAFGRNNKVLSDDSFVNGYRNTVKAYNAVAEGSDNIAGGRYSHVEGEYNESQFDCQHIEGRYAKTYDVETVPEFDSNKTYYPGDVVSRISSGHLEVYYCIKACTGKRPWYSDSYLYWATYNPLVHVVGWGDNRNRKNIHTIDSIGNAMYTGDVTAKSMIIQSSTPDSTKKFKITVDDTGAITATEVT